jgi:hypothetical protein
MSRENINITADVQPTFRPAVEASSRTVFWRCRASAARASDSSELFTGFGDNGPTYEGVIPLLDESSGWDSASLISREDGDEGEDMELKKNKKLET